MLKEFALSEGCRKKSWIFDTLRSSGGAEVGGRGLLSKEWLAHLRACPACRKVAIDALSALVSEGKPLLPPRETRREAERILAEKGEDTTPSIRIGFGPEDILVKGDPEIIRPAKAGLPWRANLSSFIPPAELSFERTAAGRILLRFRPSSPSPEATITLRGKSGEIIGHPHRASTPVSWQALGRGIYILKGISPEGAAELRIKLE